LNYIVHRAGRGEVHITYKMEPGKELPIIPYQTKLHLVQDNVNLQPGYIM